MKICMLYAILMGFLLTNNHAYGCSNVSMIEDENSIADAQKCLLEDDRLKLYEMLKDRKESVKDYCLTGKFVLLIKLMLDANIKNTPEKRLPKQKFLEKYLHGKNVIDNLKEKVEKCNILLTADNFSLDDLEMLDDNSLPICQSLDRTSLKPIGEEIGNVAKILFPNDDSQRRFSFEDEIWLYSVFARSRTENGLKCNPLYLEIIDILEKSIINQYHVIKDNIANKKEQLLARFQEISEHSDVVYESIEENYVVSDSPENEELSTEEEQGIFEIIIALHNEGIIMTDQLLDEILKGYK